MYACPPRGKVTGTAPERAEEGWSRACRSPTAPRGAACPPGPVLRAPLGDARPLAGRGGGSWALLSSGVKGAFRNAAPANRFSDPDTLSGSD